MACGSGSLILNVRRRMKNAGGTIGINALWIASTALVHGMGVVTSNQNEFERVPGLTVIGY